MPKSLALILGTFWAIVPASYGYNANKFKFEIEAGPVWQSRNDVRIPNDTGTRFSLREIQGTGPFATGRIYFDYSFSPRHEFQLLAAPLTFTSTGRLNMPVSFVGATFSSGEPIEGIYKFNSYRFTYRYLIYEGDSWSLKIGATGKIRDAKIELRQAGISATDDNLGFVPLIHFDAEYRLDEDWKMNFNMDGLAAPQGRAFDMAIKLKYDFSKNWTIAAGYRMLEGGADVKDVYAFGWLHYATASVSYSF